MFHRDLRRARKHRNRNAICRLIQSIPEYCWIYPGDPWAEARYESVTITAHRLTTDTRMNSYGIANLRVSWPDGTRESLGMYTTEELKLPPMSVTENRTSGQS